MLIFAVSCTTTLNQELYDDEIVKAPVKVHQAKRYIESVGSDVSLLDMGKQHVLSVMTKSHKIEGNRQLDNVSIDWKSYEIRQDHGKEVLFVPLTHFRRTAVSKYTKDGRTKDNNYNTYSTLIIRYDSNNRMSILVGTYLYGRDMKEKEVMCMGIDFKSSGFSGYFITSYLDGTMLYGQYFEEGEKIFGFRPNPISPELRDSLPSENTHDHRHHLYLNLQFAKLTKSSNGSAIESFDYICSFCHKSWDQCTCIEIIDNPICNKCHSEIINGHCQCDYCHYCGYLIEECVCNQPNGSLNNGGNTTNNGEINGNNNNGTSGTGSTSIGGGNTSSPDNVYSAFNRLSQYERVLRIKLSTENAVDKVVILDSIMQVTGLPMRCNVSVGYSHLYLYGEIPSYLIRTDYHNGNYDFAFANEWYERLSQHPEDWTLINGDVNNLSEWLTLVQAKADEGFFVVGVANGFLDKDGNRGPGHIVVVIPSSDGNLVNHNWTVATPHTIDCGIGNRLKDTDLSVSFKNNPSGFLG